MFIQTLRFPVLLLSVVRILLTSLSAPLCSFSIDNDEQ